MPRGTYTGPKPPSAREWERTLKGYETSMNAILDLTRRVDPSSVAAGPARTVTEAAFALHGHISALLRFSADEEREGAVE